MGSLWVARQTDIRPSHVSRSISSAWKMASTVGMRYLVPWLRYSRFRFIAQSAEGESRDGYGVRNGWGVGYTRCGQDSTPGAHLPSVESARATIPFPFPSVRRISTDPSP